MTSYLFEESNLNGSGASLLLSSAVVCSILFYVLFYIWSLVLPSQGSEYAKDRWAKRASNKKNAAERATKVAAAQRQQKEEKKSALKEKYRQARPLHSQSSTQDFINLGVDSSDWFMDQFGHLWLALRTIMEEFHITLPAVSSYFEGFNPIFYLNLLQDSDVGQLFCELLDYIVAIGWIRKIEFAVRGIPVFATNRIQHKVTFPQLLGKFNDFCKLFYVRALSAFDTGSLTSFFETEAKNSYDNEVTDLKSMKVLIDLGRGAEIDDVTFDRRVAECIIRTLSLLNAAKSSERSYYSSKLQMLRDIQTSRTLDCKDSIREKPYGILLFGGSGVGKSAIVNSLLRFVLKVNGKDCDPRAIITLNGEDKFQSEFRTYHKGVILDDICNAAIDRISESPVTPIIMFLNQVPMSALNPNAEMKGMVMIEPDVVCATTNVKDLQSNQHSNEPLSINRRFEVTITQRVKPEYCKDGTEMLDNRKITHMARDQFPDYATFTLETPRYKEDKTGDKFKTGKLRSIVYDPIVYNGKPMVDVSIFTLLEFLKEDSKGHFERQAAFVAGQRSMKDMPLCEHNCPLGHCSECTLDSQAGVPQYSEVVEYLTSLEEKACEWLSSCKKSLIMSQYGHFVIAFLMRETFKSIIVNSIGHYLVAVCMIVIFDILSTTHCGLILILVTFLYCIYIAVRFYLIRRRVVDNFSRTIRPSQYFRDMDWNTRKKWIGVLVALGAWKLLRKFATDWKALPSKQAAAPITLKPDMKPYQQTNEFWDRDATERKYLFGDAGVTKVARTTTHEQADVVIGKRLKIVVKSDGEQCNGLPIKGNTMLLPFHFIPKSTEFVTVVNNGSSEYKNLPLSRSVCSRIPGTDLALWYCPGIGNQKDLTPYYPKDILPGKKLEVYMLYNDDGVLKKFPKMMANRERIITTEGGMFAGLKYLVETGTFGGLCMSTLIGSANGIPFIAGHHLAGRGKVGAAGFVTRPQLLDALEKLDSLPGVLVSHSAVKMETEISGVSFGPLTAPHTKCPTHTLSNASKIRIHGAHSLPGSKNTKSAVVTSLISATVEKVMGIPKQHGPPKDMGAARHLELDMAGKVDTATKFDQELVVKTFNDFEKHLNKLSTEELGKLGKISDDVNLAGLDGVLGLNSMNFKTSRGFPFKGPKTTVVEKSDRIVEGISCPRDLEQSVLDEIARYEDALRKGESINAIFKGARKDEPVGLDKDKVRVFAGAGMAFTMLVRKYFLTLAACVQRNKNITECAVGTVVQSPEWTELFHHIGKHGWDRGIAGDYKKFDGRMAPQFMLMAFKLLIQLAEKSGNYEEDDIMIMRGIATEISYPTYDYFGTLVQFMGSNPSGHPLTVVINSMVNSLYMRYTYFSIARKERWWKVPAFADVVSLMTYGDDNIMSVAKGYDAFNHTAIAAELAEVDIVYTMADKDADSVPFVDLRETSFLKHFAKWDPVLRLYRSPVESGSIAKMLHTHLKSSVLTMEQSSAEAIQNVALKYFECGREVYEAKALELAEVAQQAGLTGYVGPIMDYDERMTWYVEKYALDSQSGYKAQKNVCEVNSEEEQLQLRCIAEMPLKVTYKEYSFPGGASGDLVFMLRSDVFFVVEVKCCKDFGPKFKKAKSQAKRYAGAFHCLQPKAVVYGLTYTYDGFSQIIKFGNLPKRHELRKVAFPFKL